MRCIVSLSKHSLVQDPLTSSSNIGLETSIYFAREGARRLTSDTFGPSLEKTILKHMN